MNFVAKYYLGLFMCKLFHHIAAQKAFQKGVCAFYRSYVNSEIFGLMMTDLEMVRALKSRARALMGLD